ncbi:hypothetical protein PIB30_055234, partial [Stylosanthes scabra]|nr:hypothetical protein [Stylosanthes scabra]
LVIPEPIHNPCLPEPKHQTISSSNRSLVKIHVWIGQESCSSSIKRRCCCAVDRHVKLRLDLQLVVEMKTKLAIHDEEVACDAWWTPLRFGSGPPSKGKAVVSDLTVVVSVATVSHGNRRLLL